MPNKRLSLLFLVLVSCAVFAHAEDIALFQTTSKFDCQTDVGYGLYLLDQSHVMFVLDTYEEDEKKVGLPPYPYKSMNREWLSEWNGGKGTYLTKIKKGGYLAVDPKTKAVYLTTDRSSAAAWLVGKRRHDGVRTVIDGKTCFLTPDLDTRKEYTDGRRKLINYSVKVSEDPKFTVSIGVIAP